MCVELEEVLLQCKQWVVGYSSGLLQAKLSRLKTFIAYAAFTPVCTQGESTWIHLKLLNITYSTK